MNLDRLSRLEELTRRYAKYRPCGAGLGVVWVGIVYVSFVGLFLGTLLKRMDASLQPWTLRNIFRESPTPHLLLIEAFAAPIVAWLGILFLQHWVDRRFGRVVGHPEERSKSIYFRWGGPLGVTAIAVFLILYGFLRSPLLFSGDPAFKIMDGWRVLLILGVAGWSWVWGYFSWDRLTHNVMGAISFPTLFLLSRNWGGDILIFFGLYAVLMLLCLAEGGRRYLSFQSVSRELDALQSEAE